MVILFSTIILIFLIDTVLVGISFYSLKERFKWNISNRTCLFILFFIFLFLENFWLPMIIVLDLTITVGNTDIANLLDLKPNESCADLFRFGFLEFVILLVQSLLSSFIGEKLIVEKSNPDYVNTRFSE